MKPGTIVLSVLIIIMSVSPSIAGRRHGHHHNSHYYGYRHHYNHRRYGHNYYSRRGHYNHYGYGHGHYANYALGGLIVGGILGATISHSINNEPRYSDSREPVYVTQNPVNNANKPTYIIQPDGSCYVISHISNGSLVLAPASSGNCQ